MNFEKKIENIRSQPEHVRIRYVIGAVFVSMIFILIIWFAALKQSFYTIREESQTVPTLESTNPFEGFDQIKPPSLTQPSRQQEDAGSLEDILQGVPQDGPNGTPKQNGSIPPAKQ